MDPSNETPAIALEVRDLRMRYGTKDVLTGVTFSAKRGEVLALLGPNGAGKTTTIEILEDTYMALVRRVESGQSRGGRRDETAAKKPEAQS